MKKVLPNVGGAVVVFGVFLLFNACKGPKGDPGEPGLGPPAFVGSSSCSASGCHETIYQDFMETGHPYKLNKVSDIESAGGFASYYPSFVATYWQQTNSGYPPGKSSSDFAYVIGGYGWKARFIKTDGYIYTVQDQGQYNLETDEWKDYHGGETKPYNCGPCHTTGFKDEGNLDGLGGIEGTWAFPGIQCERCHGAGSLHTADPYNVGMEVNRSKSLCGECHVRGDPYQIDAKGGFIRHHEQYDELLASPKFFFDCVDCHDPHKKSMNRYTVEGIKIQCESCHYEEANAYANSQYNMIGVDCIDCHMPFASKSAVARDTFQGDVRTHLFRINSDSTANMFDSTGSWANPYLTLEYTCIVGNACHDLQSGQSLTKDSAAVIAPLIHPVQ